MFLPWQYSVAQPRALKSQKAGGKRRDDARFRRLVLEPLETRLAPADVSLSMPVTSLSGNACGGVIANFPIDVSPLVNGFGAANIALTFNTGVFDFPIGGNAATSDVSLGMVPTGGSTNWNLTANSPADGLLNITVAAKPGKSISPVQNFSATLAAGGTLTAGTTYSYTITAVTASGETIPVPAVSVTPTAGNQTASLTWSAFSGATSYNIYRSTTGAFTSPSLVKTVTDGTITSTTDTGTAVTIGAPPAIPSGSVVLVTFPVSPDYNGLSGAPIGTVTPQPITISAHNASFNTQIVGGGSTGAYTLSPAPPYSGTVGIKTVAIAPPTVVSAGTTATGTGTINATTMTVTGVTITNPGSGYISAPTVTFFGAGGTGAAGTAVLGTGAQAGQVVSVTITNPGSGYLSAPAVTFSVAPQNFSTESNTTINQTAPGILAGAFDPCQMMMLTVNMINGVAYTPDTPLTLPSGATLTVNVDGSFTYVPVNNFVGSDTFTFAAADFFNDESNTGTVTITMMPTLRLVPEGSPMLSAGQMITEDVVMDNPNPAGGVGPLAGFNVAITYDPTVLYTASDGSQTALGPNIPTDWTFTPNALTPGVLGIGAFGSGSGTDLVPSPAPIVLCTITFTVVGTTTTTTDIDLQAATTTATGTAITALSGTGGTFILKPALPGSLQAVTLTAGGSGYTTPPTVVFSGGGGKDAEARAVLQNNGQDPGGDRVIALILTNQGDGYTSAPTVSFLTGNGAPGSGAAATATSSPLGFLPGVDTHINLGQPPPGFIFKTFPTTLAENTNATASGTFNFPGEIITSFTTSEGTFAPSAPGTSSGSWTWSETAPLSDGVHTVTITATDNQTIPASGSTTFTFIVTDVMPAVVVTSSPGTVMQTTNASASGTFSDFDDNIISLTASEGKITPANPGNIIGTWSWSESAPLSVGAHTVTITATNADFSTAVTTFTFNVELCGNLGVSVTSLPTTTAENDNASFSGLFNDCMTGAVVTSLTASEGTVTPASPGTMSGTWTWSETAPLSDGSHIITITATDTSGNTGSTAFTLLVTDVMPTVTVTSSPTDVGDNHTASASGGFADFDDNVTSLTASEGLIMPAAPGSATGNWSWSEAPPLVAGTHTVTITATNADGSVATTAFKFAIFELPPVIVTTSPASLPENNNASAGGTFADPGGVITSLTSSEGAVTPASPGTASGNWTWSESAPLLDGPHTVTITVTDSNGNQGSTVFTFTVTDVGPKLAVTNAPTSVPDTVPVSASGTFIDFDDNVTSLTASEGTVTPAAPGSLSGNWTWSETSPLKDGSHTVTITATNADGSTSSTTFTFTATAAQTSPVYVDPTFTSAPGTDPSTDPGLGLEVGVNAFATITAALPHVASAGTLVLFGGTYDEPSVNFNVSLGAVDIATNPSDSPVNPTVTIDNAVTLTDSEKFDLTGVTTGTGTSMPANLNLVSAESGPGTMTIAGSAEITFGSAVSGAVVLNGGTLNPTATLTLAGSGSLTLTIGLSETTGALASMSSNTIVVLDHGSSLTTGGSSSSTYAGRITGAEAAGLNKAGASTTWTVSGEISEFGPINVVGTLVVDGTLDAGLPVNLTDPSSILSGNGTIDRQVVVTGTGSGATITSSGGTLTITAAGGTGIDVQAGANDVSISNVTVSISNIGVLLEPGSGNMTSVTGSTITGNNIGVEPLNGCLTVTGNLINSNNTGVEIPATNPDSPSIVVDPLLTLEGNDLSGNSSFGLVNATSMGITAILNWWGSASESAVAAQISGVSVDDYTPYALDAASVGPSPIAFDFFNGTGLDGNVYVTGTLGQDTITATADTTNNLLISVTVNAVTKNYFRSSASNRILIYGFGDNAAGSHDTITVSDNATSPWNAQINSEALSYHEPITVSGTSSTAITTTGFGSDVIFGGGNDNIAALTSGNNVLVAGLSTGKTGAPTAPLLSGGSGKNLYITGSVDCALAPMVSTGRLDYEALSAIDNLWAMGMGGAADAMSVAALFSVVNTPGAILTGTARATILPGSGQSWFIVKGTGNPVNTPTGTNTDYIAGSTVSPNFRQAIQ